MHFNYTCSCVECLKVYWQVYYGKYIIVCLLYSLSLLFFHIWYMYDEFHFTPFYIHIIQNIIGDIVINVSHFHCFIWKVGHCMLILSTCNLLHNTSMWLFTNCFIVYQFMGSYPDQIVYLMSFRCVLDKKKRNIKNV